MDEPSRLRMRTAHLNHSVTCACGRQLRGNGRTSHQRTCLQGLEQRGWPLDHAMAAAVRETYPARVGGVPIVIEVERRLGRFHAERRRGGNRAPLSWAELRELIWSYAAAAAAERE